MRRSLIPVLPFCVLLSACASNGHAGNGSASTPPQLAQPADGGVECDNSVLGDFVGKKPSQDVLDQAKARAGARVVRVAQPGMAMTMDYRADRLTVMLGEDGNIENISCG